MLVSGSPTWEVPSSFKALCPWLGKLRFEQSIRIFEGFELHTFKPSGGSLVSLIEFCNRADGRARSKAGGASADKNNLQADSNLDDAFDGEKDLKVARCLPQHTETPGLRCPATCQQVCQVGLQSIQWLNARFEAKPIHHAWWRHQELP